MYDPDLHTWDADTARLERDAEIDGEHGLTHVPMYVHGVLRLTPACICGVYSPRCEQNDIDRHLRDVEIDSERIEEIIDARFTQRDYEPPCEEWGEEGHRYEEQETWDHHIVIGCNCGHQPPPEREDL